MKSSIEIGKIGVAGDEAVLFSFDDYSIPEKYNLKLTMKQAQKHPDNPVLKPGAPGGPDGWSATIYGTVLWVDGKFRMWYMAEPKLRQQDLVLPLKNAGRIVHVAYAESDDGIHWEKPNLGLVNFGGRKDNNLVLIEPEGHPLSVCDDYCCVLYDPEDADPNRRYKMAYIVFLKGKEYFGEKPREIEKKLGSDYCPTMACATSRDGLHWKLAQDTPAINECFEVAGLYKFNNKYYVEGQQFSPWVWLPDGSYCGRVMVTFESKDFLTWSQAKTLSFVRPNYESAPASTGEEVHMGAGIWNRGNVLVGIYGQWHGCKRPYEQVRIDLGLIVSNDGLHFREPVPNFALVPYGQYGEWDSISLAQGHAFKNMDGRTYIWYGQWDLRVWDPKAFGKAALGAIGLAIWRQDCFGYLSAKYGDGSAHLLTCPVKVTGGKAQLFLNVEDVSEQFPLLVALVDDLGMPFQGYSQMDCLPIAEEGVSVQTRWRGENASLPKDTPFRVKVIFPKCEGMRDPKFYAVYVR